MTGTVGIQSADLGQRRASGFGSADPRGLGASLKWSLLAAEFDYELPQRLIAQRSLSDRSGGRMLVVDRKAGTWADARVLDLPDRLERGDCLVANNSRVLPARLLGRRRHASEGRPGAAAEILLLEAEDPDAGTWLALVRPGRKLPVGSVVEVAGVGIHILEHAGDGVRRVQFSEMRGDHVERFMALHGHMPLPPYIRRDDEVADRERYQTVFAKRGGSVAAPTAGLHFDAALLDDVRHRGAHIAEITLHVGLGTFRPVSAERIEDHAMHAERFEVSAAAAAAISAARRSIAVGTTAVRTLEAAAAHGGGEIRPLRGRTDLFITPGFRFQAVDALLTNFHLPKSTLLMLVAAFAGTDLVLAAYAHAVREQYRFYSFGDCMLIV